MSHLVIDTDHCIDHRRENFVVKLRVLGMMVEFNAKEGFIAVQPIINLTTGRTQLKLFLDHQPQLMDPELCYTGTLIDSECLYDGERVSILSIRVIDGDFNAMECATLQAISNIEHDPL